MAPRYKITLTEDERNFLYGSARSGKHSAKKVLKARALLPCDAGEHGSAQKVATVAEALGITSRTIEHLKEPLIYSANKSAPCPKKQKPLWERHARSFI